MAESDDFQALKNISYEVDNSQVKILISSHCMKAQNFLIDKLRKQTERHKEICKFISSSNLKLETEIKYAEQEIKSLNVAIETIKLGNIELNKEHLLSKERKAEIFERTKIGKKKYDNLWLMSKERYENIPIIQKFIEVKNKNETVQANINALISESKHLANKIKIKKNDLECTDRPRILELAEFFARERTKMLMKINENKIKIKEMLNEIEVLEKEESKNNCNMSYDKASSADRKQAVQSKKDSTPEDNWSTLNDNSENDTLLPKLQLQKNDLDILSIQLNQINKIDLQNTISTKRAISTTLSGLEENPYKIQKTEGRDNENYISSYFDIPLDYNTEDDKKKYNKDYSEKKLIHILEDIKLDKSETYDIIKKIQVNKFQSTKYITSINIEQQYEKVSNTQDEINKTKPVQIKSLETEELDQIKLPKNFEKDVCVDPPSQFLDVSQTSREKKTVSFNIPNQEIPISFEEGIGDSNGIEKSQEKILDNSTANDDSYTTIKDKILKDRNLHLSPQFVCSKSNQMHKQQEDKTTSKFFDSQNEVNPSNDRNDNDSNNKNRKQDQLSQFNGNKLHLFEKEICTFDENNVVVSSPKEDTKNLEKPIVGFLFNHGPQGIPDSLNLSVSTTGFEDNNFPHFIDSSILLSPKADVPIFAFSSHNNEVPSQEVPNFISGIRKTGVSFFGSTITSEPKPDSGETQNGGSFNFAFGNEEKKCRGGFFSMFH